MTPKTWHEPFLTELAAGNTVRDACKAAGIARQTAYNERQKHEGFAVAWYHAEENGTEVLEREAKRRAVEGVEKAIYYQGDECGRELQYSDNLLMFLLKSRRPEKYRDTAKIEHSGSIDGRQTVTHELGMLSSVNPADLSPELQDALANELEAKQRG